MSDLIVLVFGGLGILLMLLGVGLMAMSPSEDSKPEFYPRKHLSFPRRRFLRKRARKANVH